MTSSRPYLIRAIYDWIVDNNLTPHIVVNADVPGVQVPEKYVVEGKMVLNVSAEATRKLLINNTALEFDARFDGVIWHIYAPIKTVLAIYARENGRGMIFEGEEEEDDEGNSVPPSSSTPPTTPSKPSKPNLKIVK